MKRKIACVILASFFSCSTAFADQNYTVAAGDNLSQIADKYGVSVQDIQSKNNLNGWFLSVGQNLVIPSDDNSDTAQKVAFVNADDLNFRDDSSLDSNVLSVLSRGTNLEVLDVGDTWTKVKNGDTVGFVATKYIDFNQPGTVSRGSSQVLNRVREIALSLEGTPYRYGGASPRGFDCSGFTSYVMGQFNVDLPRSSGEQFDVGTSVDRDNLQIGDLLFFDTMHTGRISHVGIYIGNNKMIHAATSEVEVSDLDWYFRHCKYYGAKRVL